MNYNWLRKNPMKNLIVFMNGWGMNKTVVQKLSFKDYDVLMVNDYREYDDKLYRMRLSGYQKKYLIAWSMGVYVSGLFGEFFNDFDKKVAIAGTQKIIDDEFGIPKKIYNYTIKHFDEESMNKFFKNIFLDDKKTFKTRKTIQELQDELIAIKNYDIDYGIRYDKAIIPTQDIIIPYKNQLNYWKKTSAQIMEIDSPHYVFDNFKRWQDILC